MLKSAEKKNAIWVKVHLSCSRLASAVPVFLTLALAGEAIRYRGCHGEGKCLIYILNLKYPYRMVSLSPVR